MLKIFLAIFILGIVPAMADVSRTVETVASSDSVTAISVPSTNTIYTRSISMANVDAANPIGIQYKATSSGTIALTIQPEQSFQRPTTEGLIDATYVPWGASFTTSDATWKMATEDTVVVPYARFKITGTSGNDASTTVQIKVGKR